MYMEQNASKDWNTVDGEIPYSAILKKKKKQARCSVISGTQETEIGRTGVQG
jgi:hypothetical protein